MQSLKRALEQGQSIVGTSLKSPSPQMAEMLGHAGFDFGWLDTEHSPYAVEGTEDLIRAADTAGLPCLVRVPGNNPLAIEKSLDYGAQGVVVPHISNAEDAIRAVRASRFAPEGDRGASPTVRAAHYGRLSWSEYLAGPVAETLLVAQVEGQEGISNLEEILAVPGVDVLFIGCFDLAASLGVAGQMDHPRLLEAIGDIVERTKRHGVKLGIWLPTPEQLGPWIARGVQFITVANTDTIFFTACRDLVVKVRAQIPSKGR